MVGRQTEHHEVVEDSALLGAQARVDEHAGLRLRDIVDAKLLHGLERVGALDVQFAHGVTVEQYRIVTARARLLLERGEMGRHLPAGEIEERLGAVRHVLAEMRRAS